MTETIETETETPPIRELPKSERRVLGVLVEKAFTTPEYYPLTLKAVTTGCNQKSNRDPVTNYSEDDVYDTLERLRELGLAAVVHTETGRTERFRHYMRRRFTFSEQQLAVLTELLLRGRQQLGELRARASRMVPIENLDQLRDVLNGLSELNYLQASGPLERRGVEVDHNLYPASERRPAAAEGVSAVAPTDAPPQSARPAADVSKPDVSTGADQRAAASGITAAAESRLEKMEMACSELRIENRELRDGLSSLQEEFRRLSDRLEELLHRLGE